MSILLMIGAALVQDDWIATSTSGAPTPRDAHTAVWTGREMIVWGGRDAAGQPLGDGARFDPVSNSWAAVATLNAPAPRFSHSAVWTGHEMIVWGGAAGGNSGARYDPVTDAWAAISATGAPTARADHAAVWFNDEMMIWGGSSGLQDGARYTLATNAWVPVGTTGGPPVAMSGHVLLWTGTRIIAWGGSNPGGGIYDPEADSWVIMSSANEPPFGSYEAVWTGREMLAVGSGPSNVPAAARYDVAGNAWTPIAGALNGVQFHQTVWSGREALTWGPLVSAPSGTRGGDRFDPVTNQWTPMTSAVQPAVRLFHSMVWTGSAAIIWGGGTGLGGDVLNSGAMYFPQGSRIPAVDVDTGCLAYAGRTSGAAALLGGALLAALWLLRGRRRASAALVPLLAIFLPSIAEAQEPPVVEPVPAAVEATEPRPYFVSAAMGVWFNGIEFDAVTSAGPVRLDSGAMAALDLRGGAMLWRDLFVQVDLEGAFGDEASAFTAGLDLGWRLDLGALDAAPGLTLELDVFAGPLFSVLSIDENGVEDFDPGIGFHAGLAARGRLNACWSLEAIAEYRSLSYEWSGTGAGDSDAEASGAALLLGLRWSF